MAKKKRLDNDSYYFTGEGAKGLILKARIIVIMRGGSMRELAKLLYVNPSTLYNYIQGSRLPSKSAVVLLHQWFNEPENLKVWKLVKDLLGDELASEAEQYLPEHQKLIAKGAGRWLVVKK